MTKRILMVGVAILFAASLGIAGPQDKSTSKDTAKGGTWHGWVTDTECGAKGTNTDHAACAKKCVDEKGAKYALYNTADKKVYVLDPQDQAATHAGHHVTVKGTLDGDTIHVTDISMMGGKKKSTEKPAAD